MSLDVLWDIKTSILGNELRLSEMRELVMTQNIILLLEVFSFDLGICLGKYSKSEKMFLWVGVLDLVFYFPGIKCLNEFGIYLRWLGILLDQVEA